MRNGLLARRVLYVLLAFTTLLASGCSAINGISSHDRAILLKMRKVWNLRYDFDAAMRELDSPEVHERIAAAADLGMYPVLASFEALLKRLRIEGDDDVRWRIMWSLSALADYHPPKEMYDKAMRYEFWSRYSTEKMGEKMKTQMVPTLYDRRVCYHSFLGYPKKGEKLERRVPPLQSEWETMVP